MGVVKKVLSHVIKYSDRVDYCYKVALDDAQYMSKVWTSDRRHTHLGEVSIRAFTAPNTPLQHLDKKKRHMQVVLNLEGYLQCEGLTSGSRAQGKS